MCPRKVSEFPNMWKTFPESEILFICTITFRTMLKKSGTKTPRVELEEMGPSMDLVMRRTQLASTDLYKRSLRVPKTAKVG